MSKYLQRNIYNQLYRILPKNLDFTKILKEHAFYEKKKSQLAQQLHI